MTAVGALWRSSHPGPTVMVTVLSLVLAVAAGVTPLRLALLVTAVFAGQLSVGWSNDAADARRDAAVGRADKPVARGEIAARTVAVAAGVALAVAVALSAMLGPLLLAAHVVSLVSAWSYNLLFKRTALSPLPFIVSFGLFPSLATLSLEPPAFAAPWAGVAGAMLGIAVHMSNVLPDLADDAATGVRGLPHRIGARGSAVVAFAAVLAGAAAVLVGALGTPGAAGVAIAGTVLVTGIGAAGLVRAWRRPDRTVFRLVMVAALVLVIQLAAAGVSTALTSMPG